jgi:hypothetical protein
LPATTWTAVAWAAFFVLVGILFWRQRCSV